MPEDIAIAIIWESLPRTGAVEITNGTLVRMSCSTSHVDVEGKTFTTTGDDPGRMEITLHANDLNVGANPAMVHIKCEPHAFTFFLRDIKHNRPVYIPAYGVAVTVSDDARSYSQIKYCVEDADTATELEEIDNQPEEAWEQAAKQTRELVSPVWLGVSRDVRIFETGLRQPMGYVDWIQPRFAGHAYFGILEDYTCPRYGYVAGRGWSCAEDNRRHLEESVLPILHLTRLDGGIEYRHVSFVALEQSPLTPDTIRGTHYLVSDGLSSCNALTSEQQEEYLAIRDDELHLPEETVFCCCIEAINTSHVCRYAFFKTVYPLGMVGPVSRFGDVAPHAFDGNSGLSRYPDSDQVYAVSLFNGMPMHQEEIAVLLEPGESCVMEFFLPHSPIPSDRAKVLLQRNMQNMLHECVEFWKQKLSDVARISLPEKRMEQMIYAGLLHLDLVTYGLEPDGTLNPSDGAYSGLGSETTRNIAFFDSMGWHDIARRSLDFFLKKQHEDGFMQNFEGYMIECGTVLWSLGEHYRYTCDKDWLKIISPHVVKACEYLLKWREENKKDNLRDNGFGLLNGKIADPEDHERTFNLNGYAYLGLSRAAEYLADIDPVYADRIAKESSAFREDIRNALFHALKRGPVVPLADGSWVPTVGPWVGTFGPVCLFAKDDSVWTHGGMTLRDDIIGPIHLVFQEVLDVDEQVVTFLLNYQNELMHHQNVSFSQPYYSPHPWIHLARGEVKRFLKAHYNAMASLADREIYSFWEHYYHESAHKTGDEAMFLMQCRWMLYMECGKTLRLLPGIPRMWLEDGKNITLDNVASYFGQFSLSVVSRVNEGTIEAELRCDNSRKPSSVELRLPHPYNHQAASVEGGEYKSAHETVIIDNFDGHAVVRLTF